MHDWTAGYVTDIGYTHGYYKELNPLVLRLAMAYAGLVPPAVTTACELGFGQGASITLHAAASGVHWCGTDFNPSQAAHARALAGASAPGTGQGAGVGAPRLEEDAFDVFCAKPDLPEFDFIGLHGIWSWISPQNQAVIVEFVRRKLRPGGVLYVSYNTLPGWGPVLSLRHLLAAHGQALSPPEVGSVVRIEAALDFASQLLATQPQFLKALPTVAPRLDAIREQSRNYLAHEYFNQDWHPLHFTHMAAALQTAKLQYGCSAHYAEHVPQLHLTEAQQQFLHAVPSPVFREQVLDYMTNQQFRRDYWVKGCRRLARLEQLELLRDQRVLLVSPRNEVVLEIGGALGNATLSSSIYSPLLDLLADHKPWHLGRLEQELHTANITLAQIAQAVLLLCAKGDAVPVQGDAEAAKAKRACAALNRHLLHQARHSGAMAHLASPMSGGGIAVNRFQQLFLLARSNGRKTPEEWAQYAWNILSAQGQHLLKDGKALSSTEENVAELTRQAQDFSAKSLPILAALQIA